MGRRQVLRIALYVVVFPWGIYLLARRLGVRSKKWAIVASVVGSIVVIGALGSLGSSSDSSATTAADPASAPSQTRATTAASLPRVEQDARDYIVEHGGDAYRVRANVANVVLAYSQFLAAATQANLVELSTAAQEAHDDIDSVRHDFAGSYGSDALGNAQLDLYSGANDLKNAMGALVAVTGDPGNAATVAKFNVQFANAKNEWNNGAHTVWKIAHRTSPPTI